MLNRNLIIICAALYLVVFAAIAQAQLPQISSGLSYLTSSQNPDDTWEAGTSPVEATSITASVLETLKMLNQTAGTSYTTGIAWLQGQSPQEFGYIAERIRALTLTDGSQQFLLSALDHISGAWGGDAGDETDILDTTLALQALKAANYTDQAVIFGAINYLLSTQKTDGGWGFTQKDDSNVYISAQVLSTLAQYKNTYFMDQQLIIAAAFLLTQQNPDGGFATSAGSGQGSSPSNVYETALAFIALIESGQTQGLPLQNAVNYLTATQSANGSWNDDPYATALALRALAHVKPNLAISPSDITFSQSGPTAGATVTIRAAVRNDGTEKADNTLVQIYDGDPAAGGSLIAGLTIPTIAPAATVTVETPYTLTGVIDRHAIHVRIDPLNAIEELNEADNSAVNYITAFTPADLYIDSSETTYAPAIPTVDLPLTLTFTVRNLGERAATNVPVRLYKGLPENGAVVGTYNIPDLQGHGSFKLTATINNPIAGLNTFYLVADPENVIPEIDETNNSANITVKAEDSRPTDLSVRFSDISFSFPTGTATGNSMTIRALVNNAGSTNVQTGVSFYQGDPKSGGTLIGKTSITVPAMDRAVAEVGWSVPSGNPAIYVVVDPDSLIAETDETNNTAYRAFDAYTQLADLRIEAANISYYPANPTPRTILTIQATAFAAGGNQLPTYPNFRMDLYDGAPEKGGVFKGSFYLPDSTGLSQLGSGVGTISVSYPTAGVHEYYVIVDPTNTIPELSEENNRAVLSITVAENTPKDLSITGKDIKFSPAAPLAGSLMTISATVHNASSEPVNFVQVSFYNGNPSSGGKLINKVWPSFSQESSGTAGTYFTMPPGIPEIYVVVDSDNLIQEIDETNNIASRAIDPYKKDLSLGSGDISLAPLVPNPGDATTVTVAVHSTGLDDLAGTVLLYEGTPEHGTLIGSQQIIAHGTQTVTATFPSYVYPGGGVTFTAIIENVAPEEGDLTNNRASASFGEHIEEGGTNEGKDFWIAWPPVNYQTANITIQSKDIAHVKVSYPVNPGQPNRSWVGTVSPGSPAIIPLPLYSKVEYRYFAGYGVVEDKGIHIESDQDVSVIFHTPDGAAYADDSYLALPTHLLGTRYYVLSYICNGSYTIVASEDNTHVDIGGSIIRLNRGQTYVFNSKNNLYFFSDLTGTYLQSDKPVAVIASNLATAVTFQPVIYYGESLTEQMLPISLLGTDHYTAPFYSPGSGDVFRLLAVEDGTQIRLQDVYRARELNLNAGQWQEFEQETTLHITSNKPIMVAQYAKGVVAPYRNPGGASVGDPFQMSVIPTDKLRTEYRFYSHPGYWGNNTEFPQYPQGSFVTVTAPEPGTAVLLDGVVVSQGWQPLPDTGSYVMVEVNEGEHVITADKPVGVYVHGYKDYGSYGYPAGLSVPLGNLKLDVPAILPGAPTEGQLVQITAILTNQGGKAARDVIVKAYNGDPANGGVQIGSEIYYPVVGPKESKTLTFTWDTYGYRGTNKIYVVADPFNTIKESNDADNTAMLAIDVVTPTRPDPMISGSDVTISKESVQEGETVTLSARIKNRGADAGNIPVSLYLGDPKNGGRLLESPVISGLLPFYGETVLNFTINTVGFPDTAGLYVVIDPDNVIDELVETNNAASRRLTVSRKRLALTAATDKGQYQAQSDVGITFSIKNENTSAWTGTGEIVIENADSRQIAHVATFSIADIKPFGIEGWRYRIPVTVTESRELKDAVALVYVDFNTVLAKLGMAGKTVDRNSIRVIEFDSTGSNTSEKQARAVFETDALAKVTWLMDGLTATNTQRYFAVYFDTADNGPKAPSVRTQLPVSGRLVAYVDSVRNLYVTEDSGNVAFAPRLIDAVSSSQNNRTEGVVLDDFNNDGYIDIITGATITGELFYYQNKADGTNTFLPRTTIATLEPVAPLYDMASADFKGDGYKDFVVSFSNSPIYLFWGNGNGTFTRTELVKPSIYVSTIAKTAADVDNDGYMDLLVGTSDGRIYLYRDNGDGTFLTPVQVATLSSSVYGMTAGDFDEDGNIDIIANKQYYGESYFLKGNGEGTFGTPVIIPEFDTYPPKAFDVGDINNDGHLDVIATSYSYQGNFLYYPGKGDGTFGTGINVATGMYGGVGISAYLASPEVHPILGSPEALPSQAFAFTWNTGNTFAGNYRVRVTLSEGSVTVAEGAAPFDILPDFRVETKVTTDKISYNPHETVTFSATATSLSRNAFLGNLAATVTIKDDQGTVRFTETKAIATLMPGATFTFKSYWNTGTSAPGAYPATIEVTDAGGAVIATGTQNLEISSAVRPSALLKGQIAVDRQSVLSGEPVAVSYSVTNTGNIDLPNVALSVQTVHTANQTVYDTLTNQASLPMGGTYADTGQIDTTNYTAKDYLVILRADIDGVEETVAGTYFRVEGAPSAPALSGPADGADVETFTPALSVSNASDPNDDKLTYEFEIYADSVLTTLVASGTASETAGITAWTSASLTENRTCFWRARAYDGRLYGPWMAPASFRVNTVNDPPSAPTISSPADGTAVAVLAPVLAINNASDPDSASLTYNFDLALDPDFTQIAASAKGVTSGQGTTSWTASESLQENGWYYWRVQADDWLVEGPWSATARFFVNTANDAPSAPVITAPANGSTVLALATDIIVTNSTDPDSPTLSYYFEADTVPTFDSANIVRSGSKAEGEDTTSWHVDGLQDNTRYHVRAKASDGAAESPWSAVTGFFANTVNDPPTMPILANPSDGAGVNVFAPTLSVHNATDPDKDALAYEFEVYADAAMTNLIAQAGSIAETAQVTAWEMPVSLTENQTYYWRARAYDGELHSGWTPVASFMVNTANDAPGAPKPSSPAEGSSVATLTPTLAVENAADPDSDNLTYEFEVYSGGSLVAAASGVTEETSGITTWTPGTALADNTVYQWRVRAYDGDSYGPWTAVATFTVHMPKTSINAMIDFDPDTLNKSSNGTWVVAYIELPAGFKPTDIDIPSIRLEGTIPAETWPYAIGDHDKDGIPDLMVKFKRSDVIKLLSDGDSVPVHVTGKASSTPFEGVDVIRVIQQ